MKLYTSQEHLKVDFWSIPLSAPCHKPYIATLFFESLSYSSTKALNFSLETTGLSTNLSNFTPSKIVLKIFNWNHLSNVTENKQRMKRKRKIMKAQKKKGKFMVIRSNQKHTNFYSRDFIHNLRLKTDFWFPTGLLQYKFMLGCKDLWHYFIGKKIFLIFLLEQLESWLYVS